MKPFFSINSKGPDGTASLLINALTEFIIKACHDLPVSYKQTLIVPSIVPSLTQPQGQRMVEVIIMLEADDMDTIDKFRLRCQDDPSLVQQVKQGMAPLPQV